MTKKRIFTALAILLVVVILLAILEKTGVTNLLNARPSASQQNGPTKEQEAEDARLNAEAKEEFIAKNDPRSRDQPPTPAPTAENISLDVRQEADGSVTVSTKLQGVSDGVCNLLVTNAGKSHKEEAPVIFQPSFSTCAGFSIPQKDLGAGTWQITLEVKTAGKVLTKSVSKEIN